MDWAVELSRCADGNFAEATVVRKNGIAEFMTAHICVCVWRFGSPEKGLMGAS